MSVVIPVLDESGQIAEALESLQAGLQPGDELVVVDGGSRDGTVALARAAGAAVVEGVRGRGLQMNAGAAATTGDVLVFVHADTRLPAAFREAIVRALGAGEATWGRFDLAFDRGGLLLRLIAHLISWRSRVFRSATGDQAIFVRRAEFDAIGGFREPHLFEDVDLVRRLRPRGRMAIPAGRAITSARRWRNEGVWRTTFRMWTLKSLYLAGVPAERLAAFYADER